MSLFPAVAASGCEQGQHVEGLGMELRSKQVTAETKFATFDFYVLLKPWGILAPEMHADCFFKGSVFGQKEFTIEYYPYLFKNINMEK